MITHTRNRYWVIHEENIAELLNRVEAGDLAAEEALSVMDEHAGDDEETEE